MRFTLGVPVTPPLGRTLSRPDIVEINMSGGIEESEKKIDDDINRNERFTMPEGRKTTKHRATY
jgi:hypothetical protein